MVECKFIWLHNISGFTCVNVVYIYQLSERSKNGINFSPRESSKFYGTLVDSSLPTYLGICFISYLDLLMSLFYFILLIGEKHL